MLSRFNKSSKIMMVIKNPSGNDEEEEEKETTTFDVTTIGSKDKGDGVELVAPLVCQYKRKTSSTSDSGRAIAASQAGAGTAALPQLALKRKCLVKQADLLTYVTVPDLSQGNIMITSN